MATPAERRPGGTALARLLASEIREAGPMDFEAFMARCLYDARHGYYAATDRRIGRRGDFHTSVSVGAVFGELIAEWVAIRWPAIGRPERVTLVEQGAHDGQLMTDVLEALSRRHPRLRAAVVPVIVEPLAARRKEQQHRLGTGGMAAAGPGAQGSPGTATAWVSSLEELAAQPVTPTLFFANELLDAFPVARWRYDGGRWWRLAVAVDGGGRFRWHPVPAPDFQLPGGEDWLGWRDSACYETETCPGLGAWVSALARVISRGHALVLDYGRDAADYYAPHRTAGTLRGYRDHRRCDDPLSDPGETDLTADVDFSHLTEEARRAGFRVGPPERQGTFLTRLASPRLLERPAPDAAWLRQFQSLTHPNHLGHVFHALELEKSDRSGTP